MSNASIIVKGLAEAAIRLKEAGQQDPSASELIADYCSKNPGVAGDRSSHALYADARTRLAAIAKYLRETLGHTCILLPRCWYEKWEIPATDAAGNPVLDKNGRQVPRANTFRAKRPLNDEERRLATTIGTRKSRAAAWGLYFPLEQDDHVYFTAVMTQNLQGARRTSHQGDRILADNHRELISNGLATAMLRKSAIEAMPQNRARLAELGLVASDQ